ncbi:MAG: hypothetical protein P8009_01885 [Gammaproteobacteria bacterium]
MSYIEFLAEQAGRERIAVTPELDAALTELDAAFEELAPALAVEYVGPGVGVEGAEDVYRLVIRPHEWVMGAPSWSLKICDALPNAGWRVAWAVQGASRARKSMCVKALPQLLRGYVEAVRAAGKADTEAGQRLAALAEQFEQVCPAP